MSFVLVNLTNLSLLSDFTGALIATSRATFGRAGSTTPIYLDQVTCAGNEPFLSECPHRQIGSHDCYHFEDAGVVCQQRTQWVRGWKAKVDLSKVVGEV